MHFRQKNCIEALKQIEPTQGIDPGHVNSAWNAGNVLFHLRRLGEVVTFCRRVLEPDDPDDLHQLARNMIAFIDGVSGISGTAAGR